MCVCVCACLRALFCTLQHKHSNQDSPEQSQKTFIYLFIYKLKRKKVEVKQQEKVTLAVKNINMPAEEEQLSVTLLRDVDGGDDVQIPDTAHQISTGTSFLNFLLSTILDWML